ncbi:beta-ketoacyl-ACP synthase II [Butyricicoccus porcorum]|uniref:3-oxoacyl-[acyl-carrier-protein] synthase 2 n=1 Tax=Butyricicoccus porcorum TaxID=1945634 RepID=A0A252F6N4_9FIRM|nr:beta-ketoacyl-ACP synthase II [Butyricicoccus porcorum]MDD6986306.1 beta-ketoacyl-ACP synthase II [Butyricicoccus porcorum]MDY4483609.1 beta-ketoacyl-ACP synthase II [Butyricicoccus porcorum]OUM21433.1 beta-ketoacyl-[acyl-carrier-protein] synthase II [Butyricicoccus porcorum]
MERVVITGIGAVTPIGNTAQEYWDGLLAGKNGIAPITRFDTEGYKASVAGEVKDFDPTAYIDKREAKHMDRFCQYALAAAAQAMEQSGLKEGSFDPFRAGTLVSSGIGGIQTFSDEQTKLNERGARRVSPFCIPMMIGNMASAHISMTYGLKGSSLSVVSACASGTHAVGEGMRAIRHGYLDIAVVGGAESSIVPIAVAGFANMHALSTESDPEAACCPFDARRSGFIMGEGAGVLVLESLSHAKARGATILAEVAGYGTTSDAYHITSPDPTGEGPARAMTMAIEDAGLTPADIDYINAHGTSTPVNDKCETDAIKMAFGESAQRVKISSTKSMTGHLLGAAGAIEAIACAMAVKEDKIPPTIHYEQPDETCDLDYVPNQAVSCPVSAAISNSLGFGGHNATILIRKYQD